MSNAKPISDTAEHDCAQHGEAQLRVMLEQLPAVLWTTDSELRFTSSSGKSLQRLNLQPNQAVGLTLYEFFQTEDSGFPPIAAHLKALSGHSASFEQEWGGVCFSSYVEPLRDDQGKIIGCIGLARETTEQKRTEEALRESQQQLRRQFAELELLYRTAPVGLCVIDPQMRFISINDQMAAMHGPPAADHIGKTLRDIIPNVAETVEPLLQQVFDTNQPKLSFEVEGVTPARPDEPLIYLVSYHPICDDDGLVYGVSVVVQDITKHKQSEQLLQSGNRILERIVSGESLDEILTTLVISTEALVTGARVSVMLLDREQNRLRVGIAPHLQDFFIEAIDGVEIGPERGGCAAAAFLGKRVIVADTRSHPNCADFQSLFTRAHVRACWSEPIFDSAGEVVGTLALHFEEPQEPGELELELTQSAAHLAGIAIERKRTETRLREAKDQLERRVVERTSELQQANIRLHEEIAERRHAEDALQHEQKLLKRLLEVHDRERRLVAYEIHDGLVQQMTGALMHLQTVEILRETNPSRSLAELKQAIELSTKSVDEARRVISGLRPPVLDELGIIAAIEYVVNETREVVPSICFQHQTSFERLAAPLENAMFRIIQEALNNVSKHSGAQTARVELIENKDYVRLKIRDWGCGFDPAQVTEDRFGLQGIRERARLLGSYASIESAPGKGTLIVVDFPLLDAYKKTEEDS